MGGTGVMGAMAGTVAMGATAGTVSRKPAGRKLVITVTRIEKDNVDELKNTIKVLICEALQLEDVSPSDIEDDAPLFGEGLGLDSVDALELAIEIEKQFGVRLTRDEKDREAFASVSALARHLMESRKGRSDA